MTSTASGWTGGKAGASGRRGTTGAWSAWACRGSSPASRSIRGTSPATIRPAPRSRSAGAISRFRTADWTKVSDRLALKGDDHVYVPVEHGEPVTHVRLNIFPDGGVARLRVWGRVAKDWSAVDADARVDLLAMENGGRGIIANDEHYGCVENLYGAGARREHGRRLGDEAAARAGARLGSVGARRAGADRGGRRRHRFFQRQLSGPLLPPGVARRGRLARGDRIAFRKLAGAAARGEAARGTRSTSSTTASPISARSASSGSTSSPTAGSAG